MARAPRLDFSPSLSRVTSFLNARAGINGLSPSLSSSLARAPRLGSNVARATKALTSRFFPLLLVFLHSFDRRRQCSFVIAARGCARARERCLLWFALAREEWNERGRETNGCFYFWEREDFRFFELAREGCDARGECRDIVRLTLTSRLSSLSRFFKGMHAIRVWKL